MPIKPFPVVIECPKCGWKMLFAPASDAVVKPTPRACEKCGHAPLERKTIFTSNQKEACMSPAEKPTCPTCKSKEYVVLINTGEVAGTVIGTAGGAAAGYGGAAAGAATGAAIGSIIPGIGTAIGAVAGGIMGALTGAAAGGVIGNKVGEQIDKARRLYKCNKCGVEVSG